MFFVLRLIDFVKDGFLGDVLVMKDYEVPIEYTSSQLIFALGQ